MSAEQDAGKSGKKLAALLGLGSIILFGGGYIAFSKLSGSNSDMQSAVNINSAASGGTRSVTETPHYRELLRADNERGAAAAARNNQTFIASLPQGLDIPDTPEKQQQPAAKPENYAHRQASGTPQEDRAASEKRMERLQKLIVRIKDQHPAGSTPTIATTMWNKSPAETTGQNGTQQFALQNASLSTPVAEKGIQLIPALTRIPEPELTTPGRCICCRQNVRHRFRLDDSWPLRQLTDTISDTRVRLNKATEHLVKLIRRGEPVATGEKEKYNTAVKAAERALEQARLSARRLSLRHVQKAEITSTELLSEKEQELFHEDGPPYSLCAFCHAWHSLNGYAAAQGVMVWLSPLYWQMVIRKNSFMVVNDLNGGLLSPRKHLSNSILSSPICSSMLQLQDDVSWPSWVNL